MHRSCEDCRTPITMYRRLNACANAHISTYSCCEKLVCPDRCQYTCKHCQKVYFVDPVEGIEDFYEASRCPHCDCTNPCETLFSGDLRGLCGRMCECGVHLMSTIVVDGTVTDGKLPEPLSPVQKPWSHELWTGRKTSEGRVGPEGKYDGYIGKKIWLRSVDAACDGVYPADTYMVLSVKHYPDLDSYLDGEGWEAVAPHTSSRKAAREAYLAIRTKDNQVVFSPERIQELGGINAIRLTRTDE